MAKYNNLPDLFAAIADSIREQTGKTDGILAEDFPNAIKDIRGKTVKIVAIDYSNFENGSFTVTLETGEILTYIVAFSDGKPSTITDPSGFTVTIEWGDS